MLIEITDYRIDSNEHTAIIRGNNVEDLHLQQLIERNRVDDIENEIQFVFSTSDSKSLSYLHRWLHRQKRVQELQPATWGEAFASVVGTITDISGKYLELDY